ncbi:hypothetical protein ISCGN_001431 [Ixodes scapularis]
MTGRPYKATDFKDVLFSIIDRKDLIGLGPYQMSHVWMAVFANGAAKLKIKACEELLVKQKRCLIIDPCKEEIKLKLLWLPIPLPDSEIKKVLEPFGTVKDIKRERWRFSDLEETETLTRVVTLVLKEHLTVDKVPHTLTIFGVNTLVVIPGRPPLCLRCKSIGHIRRQCRTPQCHNCWRYGHESEECVVTYASKLLGKSSPEADDNEHIMDVEEMCNNDDCSTQDPPDTHREVTTSDAEVSEHLSGEQTPNVDKEVCPVQGLQASLDDDVPPKKSGGREQLVQLLHVHHLWDHNSQVPQAQYLMSTIWIAAKARNMDYCPPVKLLNFMRSVQWRPRRTALELTAYGGRCSDTHVTVDSGFLGVVQPGDVILADKGFPGIKAGLKDTDAVLVMPPFLSGNGQFSEQEVQDTYNIAQPAIIKPYD